MMAMSYYGATDVGNVRENNEDVFISMSIWDDCHILLAAIDGMGGEEGGEVAAATAKEAMIEYLDTHRNGSDLDLIRQAMAYANNEIVRVKDTKPGLSRMGCVGTAGIVDLDAETLSIAHVGDSRLYRYSGGQLNKLTHDHSVIGYQEEQGILSEEEAMHHPRRSVILRAIGLDERSADDRDFIEGAVFPLQPGETFLFCSDGVCDMLRSVQIADCLRDGKTPKEAVRMLIEAAKNEGGKDNITAVVATVKGSPGAKAMVMSSEIPAAARVVPPKLRVDTVWEKEKDEERVRKSSWGNILLGILGALVVAGTAVLVTIGIMKQREETKEVGNEGNVPVETPMPDPSHEETEGSGVHDQPSWDPYYGNGYEEGGGNPVRNVDPNKVAAPRNHQTEGAERIERATQEAKNKAVEAVKAMDKGKGQPKVAPGGNTDGSDGGTKDKVDGDIKEAPKEEQNTKPTEIPPTTTEQHSPNPANKTGGGE